jgi:hypothetical protein
MHSRMEGGASAPPRARSVTTQLETASPADAADARDELRTFVTVSRAHPSDVQQRQVVVRIDGGRPATLLFGDSFTLEVPPGTHRLRAHNTLVWKTVTFAVEPGEHLEFIVINRGPAWTYALLAILGAAPLFLTIERRSVV